MTEDNRSQAMLGVIAKRFRLLGDPMRLRLLYALRSGEELSVGDLAQQAGASHSNASRQLSMLAQAGLVARRQEGTQVYYSVADRSIFEICETVCGGIELMLEKQRRDLR